MDRRLIITVIIIVAIVLLVPLAVELIRSKTEAERVAGLQPRVREQLERLRQHLASEGIQTFVGQTLRNPAEQSALVGQGRSATNRSWHLLGRAVDLYPRLPNGNPDLQGTQLDLFRTMHDIAPLYGFSGLAFNLDGSRRYITTSSGSVWDGGHLQYTDGLSWNQAASELGIA